MLDILIVLTNKLRAQAEDAVIPNLVVGPVVPGVTVAMIEATA